MYGSKIARRTCDQWMNLMKTSTPAAQVLMFSSGSKIDTVGVATAVSGIICLGAQHESHTLFELRLRISDLTTMPIKLVST